jgi:hypothetical protein
MQESTLPRLGYAPKIRHLRKEAILRFFNANECFRNAWSHAGTETRWTNLVGLLPNSRSSTTRDVSDRYTSTHVMSTSYIILMGYTTKNYLYAIQIPKQRLLRFRPVMMSVVLLWLQFLFSIQETGYAPLANAAMHLEPVTKLNANSNSTRTHFIHSSYESSIIQTYTVKSCFISLSVPCFKQ